MPKIDKGGAGDQKRDLRRKEIAKLYYEYGLTQNEIVEKLKHSKATVVDDLKQIRKATKERYGREQAEELVITLLEQQMTINNDSMRQRLATQGKERILGNKAISQQINNTIELMQKTGIIEEKPLHIKAEITTKEIPEEITQQFIKQYRETINKNKK